MKNLILVFVLMLGLASCDKKAEQPSEQKMSFEELSKVIGKDAAFHLFDKAGLTEANPVARGSKKVKDNATLSVTEDLVISGSVSCTTSPDAEWGGIQKFLALPLSVDGAVSYCNFNWSNTAPASSMNCPTSTSGVYRGWTSDHNYDVHLSGTITIP